MTRDVIKGFWRLFNPLILQTPCVKVDFKSSKLGRRQQNKQRHTIISNSTLGLSRSATHIFHVAKRVSVLNRPPTNQALAQRSTKIIEFLEVPCEPGNSLEHANCKFWLDLLLVGIFFPPSFHFFQCNEKVKVHLLLIKKNQTILKKLKNS